jgi:hypothetical protein
MGEQAPFSRMEREVPETPCTRQVGDRHAVHRGPVGLLEVAGERQDVRFDPIQSG